MIHVPDVRAAMEWYRSIGFKVVRWNEEDEQINWALVRFGDAELKFNIGGQPSAAHRREVDLYLHIDDIEEVNRRLNRHVEIIEEVHDTEYGMRELIIRDLNRFWVTFGQPI